jgi:hypothetical protein
MGASEKKVRTWAATQVPRSKMKQDELSSLTESPSTFWPAAMNERADRELQGSPLWLVPEALLRLWAVRARAGVLPQGVPGRGCEAGTARSQRAPPAEP